jgi:hypothetical protein
MEIRVTKAGRGVQVLYGTTGTKGFEMMNFMSRFRVQLAGTWAIKFGAPNSPKEHGVTQRLISITARWIDAEKKYGGPWAIALKARPRSTGEQGEILAKA